MNFKLLIHSREKARYCRWSVYLP